MPTATRHPPPKRAHPTPHLLGGRGPRRGLLGAPLQLLPRRRHRTRRAAARGHRPREADAVAARGQPRGGGRAARLPDVLVRVDARDDRAELLHAVVDLRRSKRHAVTPERDAQRTVSNETVCALTPRRPLSAHTAPAATLPIPNTASRDQAGQRQKLSSRWKAAARAGHRG
eukprot:3083251-Rhodomonas_salina.1